MVSCLMGDSTALASAIVRCCHKFIWSYVKNRPIHNHFKSEADIPATTPLSDRISKDLKKRGFKFVGSTIIYAYMQAIGIVNDHVKGCYLYVPE